jgi:site-specific recombinase XerD
MPDTALMVRSKLSHNVPATIEAAKTHLTDLANLYLMTEVAGQSQATLDAKRRDLQRFLTFYHHLCGNDRPEEWFVSVTKAFLRHLRGQHLAQASLVRIYATVHEELTQVDIPAFADSEQTRLASRGVLARHESQPRRKLPAVLEVRRIVDSGLSIPSTLTCGIGLASCARE